MYKLWFKVHSLEGEHSVECEHIVAAQVAWDSLNSHYLITMLCTRP